MFSDLLFKCWQSKIFLFDYVSCSCCWLSNKELEFEKVQKLQICLGVCYSYASFFYKSRPILLTTYCFVRLSKCVFYRQWFWHDCIYFDWNILFWSSVGHNYYCCNAVSFLHMSQLPVPIQLLKISISKVCSMFKVPLIVLMIVNNGGNKLFLMCIYISNKSSIAKHSQNQGTSFYRGVPYQASSKKIYQIVMFT